MEILTLEKIVKLASKVEELKEIHLEEHIDYANHPDGVVVSGYILVSGKFITNFESQLFSSKIDIDIFAPIDNISAREQLKLSLHDFEHFIKEDAILLVVKLKVDGWQEVDWQFAPAPTSTSEPVIIDLEISPEQVLKNVQDLSQSEQILIIEEAAIDIKYQKEPVLQLEVRQEDINLPQLIEQVVEQEIKEEVKEEIEIEKEEEQLFENQVIEEVVDDVIEEVKEEVEELSVTKPTSTFGFLFDKLETTSVCWNFHSVAENQTYLDIANLYNIDVELLKQINDNVKLSKGKLIKLV